MYKKTYRPCKHCNKQVVSSRHNDHESKCLRMQAVKKIEDDKRVAGLITKGFKKGRVAWNKGLTKESDLRVLQNAESLSKTLRKQVQNGTFTPRVANEEYRKKLSILQSLHNKPLIFPVL